MWLKGRALRATLLLVALALIGTGCAASRDAGAGSAQTGDRTYRLAAETALDVVAVGDIACAPGSTTTTTRCRQADTAALTQQLGPDLVLSLGDQQYQSGSLSDFQASYDKTWGALLPVTRPLPGNHEYYTSGASGYYTYFEDRQPGPPGYYRVTANGWNIYLLNSNCDRINCGTEATWLRNQMDAYPSKCAIIAMHHARYSSGGEHGSTTAVKPLWKVAYNHRADVALAGHDHDYERFKRMDPWGAVRGTRGILSFVSGTGGKSLYPMGTRKRGSVYFQNRVPGVLALSLRSGSYSWAYHAVDGRVLDSGSRSCV